MEEELFTSPQFLRRMGAGGAKPLLTKVISPLCSFFLANLFTCWLSHSTTSPQRWSAFIYIYKSIFIIHWTFKHLKAVRGCFKFFGQNRKTVLYQTIQHYPLTIHVGVQQQKPAQTLSLEKTLSIKRFQPLTHLKSPHSSLLCILTSPLLTYFGFPMTNVQAWYLSFLYTI